MGLLDMIIGWFWIFGYFGYLDIGILDRIIGYYIWMVFFHPNSDVARSPQGRSSQGCFFVLFYVILSKKVINGQKK